MADDSQNIQKFKLPSKQKSPTDCEAFAPFSAFFSNNLHEDLIRLAKIAENFYE